MASGTGKRKADQIVTAADVAPLTGTPAPVPVPAAPKPFLSEGMRHDLETAGFAVDPVSGARYELDRATGEVSVTTKVTTDPVTGQTAPGVTHSVAVEVTIPATVTDPDTGETLVTDPETGVVTATDPVTGETRIVDPGASA